MTKKLLYLTVAIILTLAANAQKPELNLHAIKTWDEIGRAELDKSGRLAFYEVFSDEKRRIMIRTIQNQWNTCINNAKKPMMSKIGEYIAFEADNDLVGIFDGNNKTIRYYHGSDLSQLASSNSSYFTWRVKNDFSFSGLVIWNASNKTFRRYSGGISCSLSGDAKVLLVVYGTKETGYSIRKIRLNDNKSIVIWRGNSLPKNLTLNSDATKIAFIKSDEVKGKELNEICLISKEKTTVEIDQSSSGLGKKYLIANLGISFSSDENQLFFRVTKEANEDSLKIDENYVKINVWHYRDKILQSQQESSKNFEKISFASFSIKNKHVQVIEESDDEALIIPNDLGKTSKYMLLTKNIHGPTDVQVHPYESKKNIYLVNTIDGSRTPIAGNCFLSSTVLSPEEKYVIYFDQIKRNYFSYEIESRKTTNISSQISVPLFNTEKDLPKGSRATPVGIAGWLKNDQAILLYDENDIWQVNLQGKHSVQNITNGYGRLNNLSLQIKTISGIDVNALNKGDLILLKGINTQTYKEGLVFFQIGIKNKLDKIILMQAKIWEILRVHKQYLVKKSSNNETANWFLTKDLIHYIPISDIQPQKKWNWYTKELIYYPLSDGTLNKGILYKPENFNSSFKYPIIFQFYEKVSDKIYELEKPELCEGKINPAWFTSRGFLVFQPDIKFKFGFPGESAYKSVVSAADFFSKKNWVDSTAMGLSGHSHGAFSVNYIVTRTSKFTAAAAACGVVDLISSYGALRETGFSREYLYETSQGYIGGTLWEKQDSYLENSAVLHADKVTTPVLIMHNKNDAAVPWGQGLEWFLSLRRLGKKAWMLTYENEAHGVHEEKNKVDYTKRLEQFFDFYLKHKLAPKWMVEGIPASKKGIDTGMSLDTIGRQP